MGIISTADLKKASVLFPFKNFTLLLFSVLYRGDNIKGSLCGLDWTMLGLKTTNAVITLAMCIHRLYLTKKYY